MCKILTFDCYGTLLDTSPLYEYIGMIAKENHLPSKQAIQIFSNYEDRLMYGEYFQPYDKLLEQVLTYCDMELNTSVFSSHYERISALHGCFVTFTDVMGTLRALKEKGFELALMSNTTVQMMDWHLEKLEYIFDFTLVAEETKCYKPNLRFFHMAEQKFKLADKEHYHIAKGYWWDIVPASKMGWKKIWVNRSRLLAGRESEKPYQTIFSLEELKYLL